MAGMLKTALRNKGLVGQGSFGQVFLLENDKGQQFALKVMSWRFAKDAEKHVAENELRVLNRISHDHVIVYVDTRIRNAELHILTEYCAGGDLHSFLDRISESVNASVPEDLLVAWLWQMCCGLEYMHSHKPVILHRDMKPSNIYLTKEGDVRLGDMGVARILDDPDVMVKTFCGTLPYMSPEVLHRRPYNAKTDIWGLGCCVVEMATLERAHKTSNLLLLRDVVMKERKPLPSDSYSKELDALLGKMLAAEPKDRLTSTQVLDSPLMLQYEREGPLPLECLKKSRLHKFLGGHGRRTCPDSAVTQIHLPELSEEDMASYDFKIKQRGGAAIRTHNTDPGGSGEEDETVTLSDQTLTLTDPGVAGNTVIAPEPAAEREKVKKNPALVETSCQTSTVLSRTDQSTSTSPSKESSSLTTAEQTAMAILSGLRRFQLRDAGFEEESATGLSRSEIITMLQMYLCQLMGGKESLTSAMTVARASANGAELE
ncbi:hypothetical protein BaRGS_00018178, partial [Batillaria attramentaria]